ncbi:MAG: Serine/threonine protein kinase Endoplasmic reticulum rane [Myxococcaceae bacterium]|nr:Serine/threonine protein kinase Endoplasmic reticulum rane [Myxococcaceae bacterium]
MAVCAVCKNDLDPETGECFDCGRTQNLSVKPDPFLGRAVGNLVLIYKIGQGAMGSVYRAAHRTLKTAYAVKILSEEFSDDETVAERFRREALACSRLQHENVVYVTDFGVDPTLGLYLVMEFVDGPSLGQMLRHGPLAPGRVGRIVEQVCDAMSAAHRLDIVHRDLKPDNILVYRDPARRDFVKVVDFGIARIRMADASEELTASGTTVGTIQYMAPEQLLNRPGAVGAWSDVYALGVIVYEMITGDRPFAATSMLELAVKHATVAPPLLSQSKPELAGSRLEALVSAMLAKEPPDRPASMELVSAEMTAAVDELVAWGVPGGLYPSGPRTISRPSMPAVGHETDAPPRPSSRPSLSSMPSITALPSSPSMPAARTPSTPSLRVGALVQRLRVEASDSAVATLLAALPGVDAMSGEALTMALWGVLQQEVLDAPAGSARLAQSCEHLALLIGAVLEGHDGPAPSEAQQRVFRALRNVLALADKDHRAQLVEALRPAATHPLFPDDIAPREDRRSLMEKLAAPLSGQSIRSLLTHRIELFGKKD